MLWNEKQPVLCRPFIIGLSDDTHNLSTYLSTEYGGKKTVEI
jgi:hypothetical protein